MNTFQLVIIGIFIFLAVFAVLAFAGVIPLPGLTKASPVALTWWGTVSANQVNSLVADFNGEYEGIFRITYAEQDPRTLEANLIEALASGQGPDLIYAPQELIFKQADKLRPFSYNQLAERDYRNTFIQQAQLFLYPEGIIALPLVVDPLMLYYNRDLLSTARLVGPPRSWKELETQNKALTVADPRGNVTQSAIALGVFSNITNAKDILAMLIIQAGNPLVTRTDRGWEVILASNPLGTATQPTADATTFFNNFSNSANLFYSWNSSLPEARQMFASNSLAMYLGYASEYEAIRRQNPQISFDVTAVPQPSASTRPDITLGRLHSLAVLKSSAKGAAAAQAAAYLASGDYARQWFELVKLPPARLELLRARPADPVAAAFFDAAIITRGWYDFNPAVTGQALRDLSENIRQGRLDTAQAVARAASQFQAILPKQNDND